MVFSIGISNREQDPIKTSIKQPHTLYRLSKVTFPNATIYIVAMNFSLNLPDTQQANLLEINDHILLHFRNIPPLEHELFQTLPDDIHWTPTTASHVFDHWCLHLGL